ncbi:MAG: sugar phosphate nucleotidyltransferase [Nanoarchaeota archaeon]
MQGLICAGGEGTRLGDSTKATNKHLLPVYDKPMVTYPLWNLLSAGIEDVLIVSNESQLYHFRRLFGKGNRFSAQAGHDVRIQYEAQPNPDGIADAIRQAQDFATVRTYSNKIKGVHSITVMLGDNVFEDQELLVKGVKEFRKGAVCYVKKVPENLLYEQSKTGEWYAKFGMIQRYNNKVAKIEEKPKAVLDAAGNPHLPNEFASQEVVVGAYIFDNTVFDRIALLKKSGRGQYEITELLDSYLRNGELRVYQVHGWWTDCGTPDTLLLASNKIREKTVGPISELVKELI